MANHIIDPDGDIFLDISPEPDSDDSVLDVPEHRFRVSSKVLCLASPVFRAMLGSSSHFQEAKDLRENSTAVIPLEGDNKDALLIILNVAHLNADLIPNTITLDVFYEIAVVCDKYDMARIMIPWTIIWMNPVTDFNKKPGYERWLAISWVFRQWRIFLGITRELVLHTELDGDDNLVVDGDSIESPLVPSNVIGQYPHLPQSPGKNKP